MQLGSYLSRGKVAEPTHPATTVWERQLEVVMATRTIGQGMEAVAGSIRNLRDEVDRAAPTTERPLWLRAALSYEIDKKPVPSPDLAKLAKSSWPTYKAAARIYSTDKLTKAEAERLAGQIEGNAFLSRLSRAHALEKAGVPGARDNLVDPSRVVKAGAAGLLMMFALGAGSILLLIGLVALSNGSFPKRGFPVGPLSLGRADLLAGRSAQLLAVWVAFSLGGAILLFPFLRNASPEGQRWMNILLYTGMVVGYLLMFRVPIAGQRISLKDIGVERLRARHVGFGVGAALANAPIVLLMGFIGQKLMPFLPPAQHPITVELAGDGFNLSATIAILLIACVAAPITEELMFRATMAPAMARVMKSPAWGILVSSLFFAAIHPTGIPAWPALAAVGAMSAFLTYRTGSLMPSLVMHAVHNFGVLMITLAIL